MRHLLKGSKRFSLTLLHGNNHILPWWCRQITCFQPVAAFSLSLSWGLVSAFSWWQAASGVTATTEYYFPMEPSLFPIRSRRWLIKRSNPVPCGILSPPSCTSLRSLPLHQFLCLWALFPPRFPFSLPSLASNGEFFSAFAPSPIFYIFYLFFCSPSLSFSLRFQLNDA